MSDRLEGMEQQRLAKIEALRAQGVEPYPVTFTPDATAAELHARYQDLKAEDETGDRVTVAGRLILMRTHGKLSFGVLRDGSGEDIQLFCEAKRLGEDGYRQFTEFDLGDWVGADGEIVKTKRGELSVRAEHVTLLAKALRPLPEKWHGLANVELRYRQRYLDLIVNPDVRRIVRQRAKAVGAIRDYLNERGFLEVETPMLQLTPGGANAKPFITHHNTLGLDLYLRIAPELFLKRLIVGGLDRVFEINRNFRNEGVSVKYNPEFTMLEAYQAYGDYFAMMDLMEGFMRQAAESVLGSTEITFQGRSMSFGKPFARRKLIDLVSDAVGTPLDLDMGAQKLREIAEGHGVGLHPAWGSGKILFEMYEKLVEVNLFEPTIVMDMPRDVSPLARPHREDPRFTEHFDLVAAGMEIGPAYSELTDPVDQRRRFEDQMRARATGDEEAMTLDEDFLKALEYGMPPTGGLGFGIDRFMMLLADVPSIRDVILFPLVRPEI